MDPTPTDICGPLIEHKGKEEDKPAPVKVFRSSKFWFEDGNIVLQAENTRFRLHRSVLSMHSRIFRNMFACGSQPENGPTVDGCPLIYLPETSEDLKNFVKILYNSINPLFNPRTYDPNDLVSVSLLRTMLHFGRKYGMKKLRKEAIQCLMSEFPLTLQEWTYEYFGNTIDIDDEIPSTSLFELLYLAHNHSIISILPALYLRICLTHDALDITDGFRHVTGDSLLINKLLMNCLFGRERLYRSVSSKTLAWLYDDKILSSSDCKNARQCQKKRSMLITKLWNNDIQFSLQFALDSWTRNELVLGEGLCLSCRTAAKAAYKKARENNWDLLEEYFNLGEEESEASDNGSDSSSSIESDVDAEELVEDS